ncbi:MAG: serine hydrolase, partial [Eubacteriales bacterium]|nr:serine hydrolase [Eubacteriales bacterium]
WSVFVKDLKTGEVLSIDPDEKMISASIIKIFIAGAYYDAVEKNIISPDYDETVRNMIVYSDNTATNELIDLIGIDNINIFISENGFSANTSLNRKMLESGTENFTTVKDCADALEAIYNGTYVNSSASGKIQRFLLKQESKNKIPSGVYSVDANAVVANKTGEIGGNDMGSYVVGDAAIVYGSAANDDFIITADCKMKLHT